MSVCIRITRRVAGICVLFPPFVTHRKRVKCQTRIVLRLDDTHVLVPVIIIVYFFFLIVATQIVGVLKRALFFVINRV